MTSHLRLGLLVAAIVMTACTARVEPAPTAPAPESAQTSPVDAPTDEQPGTVPFHLDVSNQNFDIPMVRVRVTIDGDAVIDDAFAVEGQHNWIRHDLFLPPGGHAIVVTAPERGDRFEITVNLDGERWASVNFWGPSDDGGGEPFSWFEDDEPIVYG